MSHAAEPPNVASPPGSESTASDPAHAREQSDRAEFSLLLPVYAGDSPEFLRLAYTSSVHDQTLPPSEAVIVQDGPVSAALAAELAKIEAESPVPVTVVRLPDNQGLTVALNAGLDAASCSVIARMDADDVSMPDRFAKQWEVMSQGFDLVGTGMVEFEVDAESPSALRVPPVGGRTYS